MTASRALVVVVDDDDAVRRGVHRLLKSAGYAVETFASGRGFLDHGDYDRADCLILDVRMPPPNGLELQHILATGGHDVPIVFITGHGDAQLAARVTKAGAVTLLAKPFDDDEFLAAIRLAMARPRQRRRGEADGA